MVSYGRFKYLRELYYNAESSYLIEVNIIRPSFMGGGITRTYLPKGKRNKRFRGKPTIKMYENHDKRFDLLNQWIKECSLNQELN